MKFLYNNGYWTFESETLLVRMDDATYQRHLNTYLARQGIDTRSYQQLVDYANQVLSQRMEASKQLHEADYWLSCDDPGVRILRLPGKS